MPKQSSGSRSMTQIHQAAAGEQQTQHETGKSKRKKKQMQKRALKQQKRQQKRRQKQNPKKEINADANGSDSDSDSDGDLLAAAAAWVSDAPCNPVKGATKSRKGSKMAKHGGQMSTSTAQSSRDTSPSTAMVGPVRMENGQKIPPQFPLSLFPGLADDHFGSSSSTGFLRNEEQHREAFQTALKTAYEGCVWDDASVLATSASTTTHSAFKPTSSNPTADFAIEESTIQRALATLDSAGWFRTDVTQPAGMGGKCVKTYVTRCLLGDPGTTYKYLGLRMFSHPWKTTTPKTQSTTSAQSDADADHPLSYGGTEGAVDNIHRLNECLTQRTELHLQNLSRQRAERNVPDPTIQGRPGFSVTLINKMKSQCSRLKDEPMFGEGKCTVSWHADSSLEHFSTIAVYQTVTPQDSWLSKLDENRLDDKQHKHNKAGGYQKRHSPAAVPTSSTSHKSSQDWSVALRVTHNAEGPKAKRLGDIAVVKESPPIAINVPSGAAYYLLDDHNHHHQHAVLTPNAADQEPTIRFSSTHRLLRSGHNVHDILDKCHHVIDNFHRNGPKRWKSEQLLLNEVENEWLRQFFIQGVEHKRLLWDYWKEQIEALFRCWELLEKRTYDTLCLLQHAAEYRCAMSNNGASKNVTKKGYKAQRARTNAAEECMNQEQAWKTIRQLMGSQSPRTSMYEAFATMLSERSKKRALWLQREHDPIFKRMQASCRPIIFPAGYSAVVDSTAALQNSKAMATDATNSSADICGRSPMPDGSSKYLLELSSHMQQLGMCYDSRNAEGLPNADLLMVHST